MSNTSDNNKRIAKNSLFMSIRMVIVLLISLYATRVVLEVLGVEDYGIYNVVAGFVTMFAFINSSMSSATQRFYNFELGNHGKEGVNIVYNAAFIIHLLLAVFIVICTEIVGLWYLHHKMVIPIDRMFAAEWVFHFSVFSLFFTIISVPYSAVIMAYERMNFYAIIGVIDAIIKLLIILFIPYVHLDNLVAYSALLLGVHAFDFFCYYIYSKKHFTELYLGTRVEKKFFNSMLTFSGWGTFGAFAYMLRDQGINLVLNLFFGPIVNAARGVANQVNSALNNFISNLVVPSRPQVIKSYAIGDLNRTFRLTYSISKMSCLFFYMLSLPICLEISFVLRLWLGDNVPNHTVNFIIIILFTNVFGTLVSPISTIVHATGKMRFYQLLSSSSNVLSVPLAYLFLRVRNVPEFVFIALFITMITNHLAGLYSLRQLISFSIRDYTKSVLFPIFKVMIFSLPICILPYILLSDGYIRCLFVFVLSISVVSISTYYIAFDKGEQMFVKSLVSNFFIKLKK